MAIVTAGPPAAGKTTWVDKIPDRDSYRRIDADEIKDLLLEEAGRAGLLDDAKGITLSDGLPVLPRELSAQVHKPSTTVADLVRREAMRRRENVLIEGTLAYPPLAERYAAELFDGDYERLHIVDVEVPLDVAIEGAAQRWWEGRHSHVLGGRFMNESTVATFYDKPTRSKCAATADALWDLTWEVLDVEEKRIERSADDTEVTYERRSAAGMIYGHLFPED
jgi:adenylate kinase family enzyme